MRQRIEDLGRLAVLMRNLLDHPLFEEYNRPGRPKDSWEWFAALSDDRKVDVLHSWAYGIDGLKEKLYEMLDIAEGTDFLNENVNE